DEPLSPVSLTVALSSIVKAAIIDKLTNDVLIPRDKMTDGNPNRTERNGTKISLSFRSVPYRRKRHV
uniref:Uncharacterized protein n=1 Tax=Romanomermis culicivorax TaxID=13658 RepID=A0A915IYN5_ROMCU